MVFANGYYYHVYNRGVEKRPIFTSTTEYKRAIQTINYYRFKNQHLKLSEFLVTTQQNKDKILSLFTPENSLVTINSFCLMPNHFHLLLKQKQNNGISVFLANFTNSYTKYFNKKHDRNGYLLQGTFKATMIESDDQLLHVNRYIHINPVVSNLIKEHELINYPWSSIKEYLYPATNPLCDSSGILNNFKDTNKYLEFLTNQIDYGKTLENIKHLLSD